MSMLPMYCFIPKPLVIPDRPELKVLPFNVFIARYKANKFGKLVMGSVVYLHDLNTYKESGDLQTMDYKNIYNPDFFLRISYDRGKQQYTCDKYHKDKVVGMADGGNDWKKFFIHVGAIGLIVGETCEYKNI